MPPDFAGQADGRGEERVARALGERRSGGAPPEPVDDVGLEAGGREGPEGGVGGEGQHVLVGRARGGLAPAALAAPGRGDLGRGEPPGRARRRPTAMICTGFVTPSILPTDVPGR